MMKTYYIYKMIHVPSSRIYIGQRKIPKGKTLETDSYFGSGKIWKQIYKKHKDECVKVIIDYADTKAEIDELEKKWIAYYRMTRGEFCVNISDGGVNYIHKKGEFHHTEESRRKMSKKQKGKKHSEEWRKHLSESLKGKKHTEERRKINSESHKGQVPWNKGKRGIYTPETLKRMSEAAKARYAKK